MKIIKKYYKFLLFWLFFLLFVSACTTYKGNLYYIYNVNKPVDGIRIAWDYSTRKRLAPLSDDRQLEFCGYSRIIQLNNGQLACVYETSEATVELILSKDMGNSWSNPQIVFNIQNKMAMCVPEIIQLKDNSILVACNARPWEPFTPDRKFGIHLKRSVDNCKTWQPRKILYEAQSTFEDGCWEPAMIQLPDGEVQLFFANEGLYTHSIEQNISLLRSHDSGVTWPKEAETASFRKGTRDGMPVPLVLEDRNEIIVAIEDNKILTFKPTILRESISQNWKDGFISAEDSRREYNSPLKMHIYGGSPYIKRLFTGEVLLSYQTTWNRTNNVDYAAMVVEIGNNSGAEFSRRSFPFDIPFNKSALWNSIAVIGDNIPVAITSTDAYSDGNVEVWMIQGKIIPEFQIEKGTAIIDGDFTDDCWQHEWPYFIGHKSPTNLTASLSLDNQFVYMAARVNDSDISSEASDPNKKDGIIFSIDPERIGFTTYREGILMLRLLVNGSLYRFRGKHLGWRKQSNKINIQYKIKESEDNYQIEMAIPRDMFKNGLKAVESFGVNFTLQDAAKDRDVIRETIESNIEDAPYTWCPVLLNE